MKRKKLFSTLLAATLVIITTFNTTVAKSPSITSHRNEVAPPPDAVGDFYSDGLYVRYYNDYDEAGNLIHPTVQSSMTNGNDSYWSNNNQLLWASDNENDVLVNDWTAAYCVEPKLKSPSTVSKYDVKSETPAASEAVQAGYLVTSMFGYGGPNSDVNAYLYNLFYSDQQGGTFGTYVFYDNQTGSSYAKRGLMIAGTFYELSHREAQAVTAATYHALAYEDGAGDQIGLIFPDNSNSAKAFNALYNLAWLAYTNWDGEVATDTGTKDLTWDILTGGYRGTDNENEIFGPLDNYNCTVNWEIYNHTTNKFDAYESGTNFVATPLDNLTSDYYDESGNVTLKVWVEAAACQLSLIPHSENCNNSGNAILSNTNITHIKETQTSGIYDYFYINSTEPCNVELGPLRNGTYTLENAVWYDTENHEYYFEPYENPTFYQTATITIPRSSIDNNININVYTDKIGTRTSSWGDGDKNGESYYSFKYFSNPSYQDIILISPKDTTTANSSITIQGKGSLEILKSSSETFTDTLDSYCLEGAIYNLYQSNNDATLGNNALYSLVTDLNGYARIDNIAPGIYYLKEEVPPSGYTLNNTIYEVSINSFATTRQEVTDIPLFYNNSLILKKTDNSGVALPEAEFIVKYYDVISTEDPENLGKVPAAQWLLKTGDGKNGTILGELHLNPKYLVSGSDFFTDNKNQTILPLGTITIKETKSPTYYIDKSESKIQTDFKLDTKTYVIPINTEQIVGQNGVEEICIYNPPVIVNEKIPIYGKVEITKKGEHYEFSSDEGCYIEDSVPLCDVVFELYADEDLYSYMDSSLLFSKGDLVCTLTTDINGYASSPDNLPLGKYVLKETVTPSTHIPSEDISFILTEENHISHLVSEHFPIVNQEKLTKIRIIKTDSEAGYILNDAHFSLYQYNKELVTGNDYLEKGMCLESGVTDEHGVLEFSIKLPPGQYILLETKAPENYMLDSSPILVETSTSDALEEITIFEYEITNTLEKKTSDEPATEENTSEITTEEITTEQATTVEVTTEEITTEELTTEEITTEQTTTEELSTEITAETSTEIIEQVAGISTANTPISDSPQTRDNFSSYIILFIILSLAAAIICFAILKTKS